MRTRDDTSTTGHLSLWRRSICWRARQLAAAMAHVEKNFQDIMCALCAYAYPRTKCSRMTGELVKGQHLYLHAWKKAQSQRRKRGRL